MKKHSLFIIVLALSALTGCGYKVPTTDFNKVKTAFNGVEKSFKNISANKKSLQYNGALPKYKNEDSGLNSIFSVFTNDDIRSHELDEDISYNQPPMVQFQCLKAVFDKVGKGFEFGTKYYDNITGEVYVNFENGLKDETKQDKNKYAYDFELAIDINIDISGGGGCARRSFGNCSGQRRKNALFQRDTKARQVNWSWQDRHYKLD